MILIDMRSFWKIYQKKGKKNIYIGTIMKIDGEPTEKTEQRVKESYPELQ